MFKWACLGVAVVFLSALGWMLNDLRLEVRRSSQIVYENLPPIMDKTRKATDSLVENLPEIADRVHTTTATVAELTEDIRQMRELLGLPRGKKRDETLVGYATSVLDSLEKSGGVIGLKKTVGKGLKNPVAANEWVPGARREAFLLTLLGKAKSKRDMLARLATNWRGSNWYIQVGDREPVTLLDWLKTNHVPTRELSAR
jgi:hypothetical protein